MGKPIISRAQHFKPEASHARDGVVVIFDIAGFSKFFNQPDVQSYIPKYLNHVIRCVEVAIFGGKDFWTQDKILECTPLSILPVHRKFLGDGMLYVFCPPKNGVHSPNFSIYLLNRLWNLQNHFARISKACSDFIPMAELPMAIRFGVARGTIYELSMEKSYEREFIGVCMNLASRLQKYCAGLDFISSARLSLPNDELEKHGYMKVIATKIKGFPKEIVVVDKNEYAALDPEVKKELFLDVK